MTVARVYSYVIVRDYGFAPNPFHGVCTLATCKPIIRRTIQVGDWVVGTGPKTHRLDGKMIYAMKVSEALTFDEYWDDPRFWAKRPNLSGSLKQLYGDNIYHHVDGAWRQEDSHHSLDNGSANTNNIKRDTQTDRVLIGEEFVYFGASAIQVPDHLRHHGPEQQDLYASRGHRVLKGAHAEETVAWLESIKERGIHGWPAMFPRAKRRD